MPPARRTSLLKLPFAPAIAVMNRLTFARKFLLIGLLLSVPLATLAHLQYSVVTERIEFGRREREGVAYIGPLREFLYAVERHRVLAAAVGRGAPGLAAPLATARAEADAAAVEVDRVDARVGERLRTAADWNALRERWRRLRAAPPGSSDGEHGETIAQGIALLQHDAANYSNLTLDPDLDSYWLMDAWVMKLPALSAAITRASALALAGPPDGGESDVPLAAAWEAQGSLMTEVATGSLATAFRATPRRGDADLRASLEPPLDAAVAAVSAHHELFLRLGLPRVQGGLDANGSAALVRSTLETLSRVHALQVAIGPHLDARIAARVASGEARRLQGLVAAAAVALGLAYLFIAIYLSIRASVAALHDPRSGAAPFTPESRDELGQMAVAYSQAHDERARLQEQLRLADRLATLGTLAAGTAHELNEPLGSVLGFAQLALKTPGLPESAARDLDKISRAALHAREVIRQLLLFARQTPPQKEPIDVNRVVSDSLQLLQHRCEQDGVSLVRNLREPGPRIVADAGQLRQVVLNLVVNAIQASPRGGVVTVSVAAEPGFVTLVVADRGAGVTDEVRKQMFLPFYTTKDVGQGTGLGLSVVHGIVTAHGGTVQVDSGPGHGTRIEVRLPVGNAPAAAAPTPTPTPAGPPTRSGAPTG